MADTIPNPMPKTDPAPSQAAPAPVKAMWICMILGWVFFVIPVPGTIFVAGPLNLAAFILAIVCLVRSRVGQGVIGLIGTSIVSAIIYLIGFGSMAAITVDAMQKADKQRAAESRKNQE